METANHECYVSLEVAKLLKKAGFDWKVRYMYRNNNPTLCICIETPYRNVPKLNKCPMSWQYAAPTLEIAQRWLRRTHNLHITIFSSSQESWMFRITKQHEKLENGVYGEDFYTYEEAQEAGIKKALGLILEKVE